MSKLLSQALEDVASENIEGEPLQDPLRDPLQDIPGQAADSLSDPLTSSPAEEPDPLKEHLELSEGPLGTEGSPEGAVGGALGGAFDDPTDGKCVDTAESPDGESPDGALPPPAPPVSARKAVSTLLGDVYLWRVFNLLHRTFSARMSRSTWTPLRARRWRRGCWSGRRCSSAASISRRLPLPPSRQGPHHAPLCISMYPMCHPMYRPSPIALRLIG